MKIYSNERTGDTFCEQCLRKAVDSEGFLSEDEIKELQFINHVYLLRGGWDNIQRIYGYNQEQARERRSALQFRVRLSRDIQVYADASDMSQDGCAVVCSACGDVLYKEDARHYMERMNARVPLAPSERYVGMQVGPAVAYCLHCVLIGTPNIEDALLTVEQARSLWCDLCADTLTCWYEDTDTQALYCQLCALEYRGLLIPESLLEYGACAACGVPTTPGRPQIAPRYPIYPRYGIHTYKKARHLYAVYNERAQPVEYAWQEERAKRAAERYSQ